PVDAPASVRVVLEAAAGFGRHRMHQVRREDDATWTARSGPLYLRLSGAAMVRTGGLGYADHVLAGEIRVARDETHDLVLEIEDRPFDGDPPDPDRAWSATEHAWAAAVPPVSGTLADTDATHSLAVLRG